MQEFPRHTEEHSPSPVREVGLYDGVTPCSRELEQGDLEKVEGYGKIQKGGI